MFKSLKFSVHQLSTQPFITLISFFASCVLSLTLAHSLVAAQSAQGQKSQRQGKTDSASAVSEIHESRALEEGTKKAGGRSPGSRQQRWSTAGKGERGRPCRTGEGLVWLPLLPSLPLQSQWSSASWPGSISTSPALLSGDPLTVWEHAQCESAQ